MKRKEGNSLRLGFFITAGTILFVLAIYFLGTKQNLFTPRIKITATFKDVKGLREGGNVRFTGIDVGSVTQMVILSDSAIMVEMAIDQKVVQFIKKNSVATIASVGLMGNKIIVLLPGSPDEEYIGAGDNLPTIEPVEMDDILREIQTSSERISVVSSNLIDITEKINRGEGMFGKIFTDTTLTDNLTRASVNLKEISERVNRGEGLMGKLFADTTFSNSLDSTVYYIAQFSDNMEEITDKINRGEGIFGKFFTDTTLSQNLYLASKNLNDATRNLEGITADLLVVSEKMSTGEGVFNKFLVDSVFADSLDITLYRLNESLEEIRKASEAIQRSGLVRMFSKKEKDGEKEDNREQEP